jgi:hypothetical protein
MGHKGVSKRKPKKSNSSMDVNAASNPHAGETTSTVQALVKDKDALLKKGGTNPSAGSNKKGEKADRHKNHGI